MGILELLLQRTSKAGEPKTFGILYDDNQRVVCYSLEDTVRETSENVIEWKVKGETAIPSGRYKITLEWSPRFGVDTITLHNVPGFEHIRMHGGNTTKDTEGCPLLGMKLDANGIAPGTSRPAVKLVKSIIKEAIQAGQEVWIDVRNA